jgi:hypothetical protein
MQVLLVHRPRSPWPVRAAFLVAGLALGLLAGAVLW